MSNLNGQSEPNQSANYEDPERIRLQPPGAQGPKYTQQINETNELGVNFEFRIWITYLYEYTYNKFKS